MTLNGSPFSARKMSTRLACTACRTRKTKCSSDTPRCVRCTNMGISNCIYKDVRERSIGTSVGAGKACISCRAKKKKCDSKRPCTSCTRSRKNSDCVDDHVKGRRASSVYYNPPLNRQYHDAGFARVPKVVPPSSLGNDRFVGMPQPTVFDLTSPTSDVTRVASNKRSSPRVNMTSSKRSLGPAAVPINPPDSVTSLDLHPRPRGDVWKSINGQVLSPFPGMQGLRIEMSDTNAADLDSRSLWVLSRLPKPGVFLGRDKLVALRCGDQSGYTLDRVFVCLSHMLGMPHSAGTDNTPIVVRLYAERLQITWKCLVELFKGGDYALSLQAAIFLASGFAYMMMKQTALLYIWKSCNFIELGGIRFIPANGLPPELTEETRELVAALSQTIYWENYMFLVYGGSELRWTAQLEREFTQDLPQVYPNLFKICSLAIRTRGILLIRDTIHLLILPADTNLRCWRQSCDRVFTSLKEFSKSLLDDVDRFFDSDDRSEVEVVNGSCVTCLVYLAILCEAICRMDPVARTDVCNTCDWALREAGKLTSAVGFDEFCHLDLLLGDAWGKSIAIFDARIESVHSEDETSLQHYRTVIKKASEDFQSRLPEYGPPMLFPLATLYNGTTRNSGYPGWLSARARPDFAS